MQVPAELTKRAFDAFDTLLNDSSEVLELEILPSALAPQDSPFLREGKYVGISKKALAAAYRPALTALFEKEDETLGSSLPTNENVRASAVVLLLAPEHLTAANLRKRYLLSLSEDSKRLQIVLAAEMRLLDSFFCSPMPRHTKSPTLWSHRNWLMKRFRPHLYGELAPDILNLSLTLKSELKVIQLAAAHHPRNYYAFDYLRDLINHLEPCSEELSIYYDNVRNKVRAEYARHAIPAIQKFCEAHISDTSAWSALLFLLRTTGIHEISHQALAAILDLVTIYKWKGEAVWAFLRTAIAGGVQLQGSERHELEAQLKAFVAKLDEAPPVLGTKRKRGEDANELLIERDVVSVLERAKSAIQYISSNTTQDGV